MTAFVSALISRVRYQLRRHGLKATFDKTIMRARNRIYLNETHIWYELEPATDRPQVSLAPGLTLVQGSTEDLSLLDELPTLSAYGARQRMEAGHDLWLVLDDRRPAFACWILRNSAPVLAARDGRLTLPPEIVNLEDSVTSASYRGRSIAPAAWSQIADRLEETEVRSIITKIEESNTPTRRAIVKSGFHEIATVRFRRVGLQRYTTVQAETGATAGWLAKQLAR